MKITATVEVAADEMWQELSKEDRDEMARNIPVDAVVDTLSNTELAELYANIGERLGKPDAAAFAEQLFVHYRYVETDAPIPPFVSKYLADALGKVPR